MGCLKMAKSKYEAVCELDATLKLGQYIIDKVEAGAKEEAEKELKLKRSLWKYTGKRK